MRRHVAAAPIFVSACQWVPDACWHVPSSVTFGQNDIQMPASPLIAAAYSNAVLLKILPRFHSKKNESKGREGACARRHIVAAPICASNPFNSRQLIYAFINIYSEISQNASSHTAKNNEL